MIIPYPFDFECMLTIECSDDVIQLALFFRSLSSMRAFQSAM